MNHDTLFQLRNEVACVAASLKKCEVAYRGFRAFRDNEPGLAFCAAQLLQAAAMLREHAEQLSVIAEDLHTAYSGMPEQLDLHDVSMDGHP